MTYDAHDDSTRLARLWDAHQVGEHSTDAKDRDLLAAIHHIEAAAQTPPAPPELAALTWEALTGAPLPLVTLFVVPAASSNGRHADAVAAAPVTRAYSRRQEMLAAVFRAVAIGTMAGFAAGFAAGLWMRVAMRVSGFLTVDANRGLLTENEAVVGEITLAGTLSIAMFGAIVGIMGGLLYVALRRWFPGNAWQRPLGYGGLLLGVFGFFVMDQNNPDYRLFGPPWVNVGMCSIAYILFGVLTCVLVDWLDRRVPHLVQSDRSRRQTVLTGVVLAPFALLGCAAIFGAVAGLLGSFLMISLPGVTAGGLAFLLYKRVRLVRTLPVVAALVRRPALVGYAAFAVPSLIGLVLTLRAITAIVGG
jgi:hypothetical protein